MTEFQNNEINRICRQVGDDKINKTMRFQIYNIYEV